MKKHGLMLIMAAMVSVFIFLATQESFAQMAPAAGTVRQMTITGEIAKAPNGYIIRGQKPAEIFTILNPDPKTLDKLIEGGKMLKIDVRIVSGDNVDIAEIDGKKYSPAK